MAPTRVLLEVHVDAGSRVRAAGQVNAIDVPALSEADVAGFLALAEEKVPKPPAVIFCSFVFADIPMTIGKRLILLLAVPLIALLGFGVFARIQLSRIEERSRFVAESQLAGVAVLGNISRGFAEIRVNVRSFLLAVDQTQRDEARAAFDEDDRVLTQLLQQYGDSLISDGRDRRLFGDFRDLSRQYIVEARHVMTLAEEGRKDDALASFKTNIAATGVTLSKISSEWIEHSRGLGNSAARAALAAIEETRRDILAADVAALLLTGLLGFLTFRRIVNPIQALERSVKTIAAGDYSQSVPFTNATDETGSLARSIEVLKQGAAAIDEQRWVKSSASNVIGELQGANTLPEFGQRFLSGLVPLLGGGVAAFYLFDDETGRLAANRRLRSGGRRGGCRHLRHR